MGIASIVGRIAKAFKGGGRLAKNVIDKGRQIIGKVSPFIKKGFEFAQRIPGFINNAKRKKEQVSDDIKGVYEDVTKFWQHREPSVGVRRYADFVLSPSSRPTERKLLSRDGRSRYRATH